MAIERSREEHSRVVPNSGSSRALRGLANENETECDMKTIAMRLALLGLALGAIAVPCIGGCRSRSNLPSPPEEKTTSPIAPPLFEDITGTSGVAFRYRNGEETADHVAILESLGGGAALLDYNGDHLLDIYLPGGGFYTGEDKKTIAGYAGKLYKNLGKNRFQDVTFEVGLEKRAGGQSWFYTHGAAVADYDRDGWPDLLVTGWGHLALFHNVAVDERNPARGRRFVDVTAEAGLSRGIVWATGAAFGDLDGDGFPDLYVCQYVNWSFANNLHCSDGKILDICPPKNFDGLPHKVYRNNGKGCFVDVSEAAGLVEAGRDSCKGLGVVMVDLNDDGKPDIYVANDTTRKLLYINRSKRGAIRFEEVGSASGTAFDDRGNTNGSMGVDAADFDGSGKPCLWVTNYENELHGLYRNAMGSNRIAFQFQTNVVGLAEMGQKYVGWGTAFLDADLDGWEDLFVANGHVMRFQHFEGVTRQQPALLFRNLGGRFTDVRSQLGEYGRTNHLARGAAVGDLDNDGRPDLVICHQNEPTAVLRGIGGTGNHWLGVQLVGAANADAVGTRAELRVGQRTLTRFVKGGGSYLSSSDRRLLFGLGDATKVDTLTVTWPNRDKQEFHGLSIDCYHRIQQGKATTEVILSP